MPKNISILFFWAIQFSGRRRGRLILFFRTLTGALINPIILRAVRLKIRGAFMALKLFFFVYFIAVQAAHLPLFYGLFDD